MDIVGDWSDRIAQRFTPAEASFAAEVGIAYAAGGSRRKDLFPGYDAQPGAFGPGALVACLPMILRALAQAGPVLLNLLGSGYVANFLAATGLVFALRQDRDHRTLGEQGRLGGTSPADESPASAAVSAAPSPPASIRRAMDQSLETLRARLTDVGFDQPRANELAYGLLEELLSDAAGGTQFIGALTAVPDEVPERDKPARRIFKRRKGTP
jgi:hypothetical protein